MNLKLNQDFKCDLRNLQQGYSAACRLLYYMLPALIICSSMLVSSAEAQSVVSPQGSEYAIAGQLPGDQVDAALAFDGTGGNGYLVWSDNHSDAEFSGITAVRVSTSGSAEFEKFRVNSNQDHYQDKPDLTFLKNGKAIVVWQSGELSKQNIHARVINADGTFISESDIVVNTHRNTGKLEPSVTGLSNGNAVVAWTSIGQDDAGSASFIKRNLKGVFAQIIDETGQKIGSELQINTTVAYNQRSPKVVGLKNGNFAVVWVSEKIVSTSTDNQSVDSVNVYIRLFDNNGNPISSETRVNQYPNICANPSVVEEDAGNLLIGWSEKDLSDLEASWDVKIRSVSIDGLGLGSEFTINEYTYGDQYAPEIVSNGGQELVVWTSMGQDGSWEGVYGRILSQGSPIGSSFLVNDQTASKQMLPDVGSYLDKGFLVVWSSFIGGAGSVDLMAKRYSPNIPPAGSPFISALSPYELMVAWPVVEGFNIDSYLVYVEGESVALETEENFIKLGDLNPGQTKNVRLAFKLDNGLISPLSEPAAGTTWGRDTNFNGLPDDWEQLYFGDDKASWPDGNIDTDGDGVSNVMEFFAGTNPIDSADVIEIQLKPVSFGWELNWKTKPGNIYRLQKSSDFEEWLDVTGYRFAAGNSDSVAIEIGGGLGYFRIIMER